MKIINKAIKKYGVLKTIRILFYPLTLLAIMPLRLTQTIWNARLLARGKWSEYNGFFVRNSINCLFYRVQCLNFNYFGRDGVSPYVGLGNFHLSTWFHQSLVSLNIYTIFGAVLPLISMFFWFASHLIWFETTAFYWGLIVLTLILFSTMFYANTFVIQNYNSLGWAFFPLGMWGLLTNNYWLATVAWMAASFGSFTVVVIATLLALILCIDEMTILPALTTLPAGLKLLTHFYWFVHERGSLKNAITTRAKAIGITKKDSIYKRWSMNINIYLPYYLSLYLIFLIFWYVLFNEVSILWISAIFIYLVNKLFMRFADDQSIHMLMFGTSTTLMFQIQEPLMLIPFWLVISPLPMFIGITHKDQSPDIAPNLTPYHIQPLIDKMNSFLENVGKDEHVFMAFNNPCGKYEKLFDGYRIIKELPAYIATKRKFHFYPDWNAVFSLNYLGAPNIWGRTVNEVLENIRRWPADHVIVYQDTGTELSKKWLKAGFSVESILDWEDYKEELRNELPWDSGLSTPKWWLLKVPA